MARKVLFFVSLCLSCALARAEEEGDEVPAEMGDAATTDVDKGRKPVLAKKPDFDVRGRFAALWRTSLAEDDPLHEFRVSQARLSFAWSQGDLLEAEMSLEASGLFDGGESTSFLRDLYVDVRPAPALGFRLGQFKKPFSRVEMRSLGGNPFVSRGVANDYAADHLGYGGRDVGLLVHGRLSERHRLEYRLGVFNGRGPNGREDVASGAKDLVARLEVEPLRALELGANASFRFLEDGDLADLVDPEDLALVDEDAYPLGYGEADLVEEYAWMRGAHWMAGGDAVLDLGRVEIEADGMIGENWWFEAWPYVGTFSLATTGKIDLKTRQPLELEPIVRAEIASVYDDRFAWRASMVQFTPGANLHLGKYARIMLDAELGFVTGGEIDGSTRDGLWPDEWPGGFEGARKVMLQARWDR